MVPPNHPFVHRVFHENSPSIMGENPLFLETPSWWLSFNPFEKRLPSSDLYHLISPPTTELCPNRRSKNPGLTCAENRLKQHVDRGHLQHQGLGFKNFKST